MPGRPVWSLLLPKSAVAGLCWYPRPPSCMQTLDSSLLAIRFPWFMFPDRSGPGSFLACAVFLEVGCRGSSSESLPSLGGGASQVVTFDHLYLWSRLWGWEAWWEGTSLPAVLHWPRGPGQAWCPGYVVPTLVISHCTPPVFICIPIETPIGCSVQNL